MAQAQTGIATKSGFRVAEVAAIAKRVAAGEDYVTAARTISPRADSITLEGWRDAIEEKARVLRETAAAIPKPPVPAEQHEQVVARLRLDLAALRDVNESVLRERDGLAARVAELEELVLGDGKKKK